MNHVLILGATGYIGRAFVKELGARGISHTGLSRATCDYTDTLVLRDAMRDLKPSLVINCAAYVCTPSVDYNELNKLQTLRANILLPVQCAELCKIYDIPFAQISTGCLYNGNLQHRGVLCGFSEEKEPHLSFQTGCGIYVSSKQAAETIVVQYPKVYSWRIRLPFDEFDHERNYLSKLQRYPKVYSALNSLSHRGDFVKACLNLWGNHAPYGIYNLTNPGAITAAEIVGMIIAILNPNRKFEFWDEAEFMATVAKTPKSNCVLDVSKAQSCGAKLRHIQNAVEDSLRNWVPEG